MTTFYFCLEHDRVETEANKCRADNRMGPYPTEEAARNWKSQVEERNDAWDDADEEWESWGDEGDDAGQ